MEAFQTAVEKEFNLISSVAKQEVNTVTDVNSNEDYLLNVFPEMLRRKCEKPYDMTF